MLAIDEILKCNLILQSGDRLYSTLYTDTL